MDINGYFFARRRNRWRQGLATLTIGASLWIGSAAGAATLAPSPPQTLTVSAAPQFTAVKLQRIWTPFLERLTALTGIKFELRHYPTIPAFEAGFKRGEADLVYLGPYHAVTAKQTQGYIPLWRDKTPLSGILVVRQDSPLRSIEQLAGATIAFPAPNAFGASLYIRGLLGDKGIHFTPTYVTTHQNVYRSVLAGDTPAGGGIKRTLSSEPASIQAQLRILFETPGVAPHPVVAHPRVPLAVRDLLRATVLVMGANADRALLAEVGFEAPIPADFSRDYAPLEKLGLERLLVDDNGAK